MNEEQEKAVVRYFAWQDRHDKLEAWKSIFTQACPDDDQCIGGFARVVYAAKAAICLATGREASLWAKDSVIVGTFDEIDASGFDAPPWALSWTEFVVARGWRDWHYGIHHDSNY